LVMSGLQANQHFFLPALAPLFYNLGQIFGATVLAPAKGYVIGGIQLPAYGMGIYGLVYGVILGAILHLSIQIPGLIKYRFHWSISLGLKDTAVRKVLTLMLPRLATIFVSQLIFLIRDNLASRLAEGSVTALTYGWMIMQVPETLIGTAIGTALLPTLSEFVAREDREAFKGTIQRAIRVLVALTIPVAVLLSLGLHPLTRLAFGFDPQKNDLLIWVTRGYLIGLTGQCLLEVLARAFYSRQEPRLPLLAAVLNLMIYAGLGSLLYRPLGAPGISLTDSIAYTFQSLFLLVMLNRRLVERLDFSNTLIRALLAAAAGGLVAILFLQYTTEGVMAALISSTGMLLGAAVALPLLWREIRILIKL
jgi:putative peptidoglycan lipid II flippase